MTTGQRRQQGAHSERQQHDGCWRGAVEIAHGWWRHADVTLEDQQRGDEGEAADLRHEALLSVHQVSSVIRRDTGHHVAAGWDELLNEGRGTHLQADARRTGLL